MNDMLTRNARRTVRQDRHRVIIGLCLLVLASVSWHWGRPTLVYWTARWSCGCFSRGDLTIAALRREGHSARQFIRPVQSYGYPDPGCIIWEMRDPNTPYTGFEDEPIPSGIADSTFRLRGSWCQRSAYGMNLATIPGDWNGDGTFEIAVTRNQSTWRPFAFPASTQPVPAVSRIFGVFRPTMESVELIALIAYCEDSLGSPVLSYRWQEGLGHACLVVDLLDPNAPFDQSKQKSILKLEETVTGGILVPNQLTDDVDFLLWQPPDGQPYRFSSETPIEDVFDQLLPIPEGFCSPPTSAPPSAPATQSANL